MDGSNNTSNGFSFILSFSSQFLIDDKDSFEAVVFEYNGKKVIVNPPFRLGSRCWRPIPLLDADGAKRLFKDDLGDFPLQVSAIPAIGMDGTPAMTLLSGRGSEFDPDMPPDSLLIATYGTDENHSISPLMKDIITPFFVWLRILTKQWWIGRGSEAQTGNAHFMFGFTDNDETGTVFAPLCRQTTGDHDMRLIDANTWNLAFSRAINKNLPPWHEIMKSDISYYKSNREYLTAVLLTCGWLETKRDIFLERTNTKLSALNVSSTDILKQLSKGFENVFGRNLKTDLPDSFEFARAIWIARGEFAHGKPFRIDINGETDLETYDKFNENLESIETWFSSLK